MASTETARRTPTAQDLDLARQEAVSKIDAMADLSAYPDEREWLVCLRDAVMFASFGEIDRTFDQIGTESLSFLAVSQ